jgi:hypothetical protein
MFCGFLFLNTLWGFYIPPWTSAEILGADIAKGYFHVVFWLRCSLLVAEDTNAPSQSPYEQVKRLRHSGTTATKFAHGYWLCN